MKKILQNILGLMVVLLSGAPMVQGKMTEKMEIAHAHGSSSDFIMGEFETVRYDNGCVKKKIIVYEIEGAKGSYYALIDGEKYKVQYGKDRYNYDIRWSVKDCEGGYDRFYHYCIVYKGARYVFNMPI